MPTKPKRKGAAGMTFILMLAMIAVHLAMKRFLTIDSCLFPLISLFVVFIGLVTQTTTSENGKREGTMHSQ